MCQAEWHEAVISKHLNMLYTLEEIEFLHYVIIFS